jgi:hypothetical protein
MTAPMNRTHWRILFVGLAAWSGIGGAASCSSDDQVLGGGRIEHPIKLGSTTESGPTKATPAPVVHAPAQTSAAEMLAPSVDRRPSRSDYYEKHWGIKLSLLDKAILDDCPERAWSKNVPDRRCTKDDECGDGFCDRARCAPLWTCDARYGMRCEKDDHCGIRPCIDGRCRSCVSDAECAWMRDVQDPICSADPSVPGSRDCSGIVGSGGWNVVPGPPPPKSKQ